MPRDELVTTGVGKDYVAKPRRRARIRPLWLALILLAGGLAAASWWYFTRPVQVSTMRAARGQAADVVYATGIIEPRRPVEVSSRVTAPVANVLADEGDRVVRGQALATLDSADLYQAIAELSAKRVNAEQSERRALALFKAGFLAVAGRDSAVAAASSARASEAAARARLNQYTIRSGISGVILRRDVEPGDLATSAKTLFQVGDTNNLRVTATVDERDIPLVRRGAEALMSSDAYPGRIVRGRVYDITPGGDPEQRAFRVRIRPEHSSELPVGLTVEVNIVVSEKANALLVPAGAVRHGTVWLVEDGRAWKVPVTTGIRGAEQVEIAKGLSEGACVIRDPGEDLAVGKRVSPRGC